MIEEEFYDLHHKQLYKPDHHYASKGKGYVYEYRLEVEEAIGRYLIPKEKVHHHYNADGSVTLVLCPNTIYHSLLHIREEALRFCGHANWRKCKFCKQYDDPKDLVINNWCNYHKSCRSAYRKKEEINDIK